MILAASFVLTTSRFVGLFSTELIYSCWWWPLECSKSHSLCFSVQFCNGKVFVVNVRSNDFICEHLRSNTSILQRKKRQFQIWLKEWKRRIYCEIKISFFDLQHPMKGVLKLRISWILHLEKIRSFTSFPVSLCLFCVSNRFGLDCKNSNKIGKFDFTLMVNTTHSIKPTVTLQIACNLFYFGSMQHIVKPLWHWSDPFYVMLLN